LPSPGSARQPPHGEFRIRFLLPADPTAENICQEEVLDGIDRLANSLSVLWKVNPGTADRL
jgi:hypothetical protein